MSFVLKLGTAAFPKIPAVYGLALHECGWCHERFLQPHDLVMHVLICRQFGHDVKKVAL